jgi:hypothetical protein
MLGNCRVAAQLVASRVVLSSTELVSDSIDTDINIKEINQHTYTCFIQK